MSSELFDLMTMNDWLIWLIAFGIWTAAWAAVAGCCFAPMKEFWSEDVTVPSVLAVLWMVIYLAFIFLLLEPLFCALARG